MIDAILRIRWLPALPYVLAGHALRTLVALIAVHPFVALTERTLGGWPTGDRMLFEPGGLMLAEVVRLHGVALSGFLEQGALFAVAMVPVGIVVSAFVLASLASSPPRSLGKVGSLAMERLAPVAILTVLQVFFAGGAILLSFVVREGVRSVLLSRFDPRTSDLLSLVVIVIGVVVAAGVIVLVDVAKTTAVHARYDTAQSVLHALTVLRSKPWSLVAAFGARASASAFVVVSAVSLSVWIGVGTDARALAVIAFQQGALIVLACLRASWLGRAMDFIPQKLGE
jgi:hypothetical protein